MPFISLGFSSLLSAQGFNYECPLHEQSIIEIFEFKAERMLTRESLKPNRIQAGFNHVNPEDLTLVTDPEICFAIRYPDVESPDDIDFEATDNGFNYGLFETT